MIGFLLISLCESVPVLSIILDIGVATNKRFAFINSDNFDDLSPLIDDVAFLISLNNSWLNMIKIIDSVLDVKIMIDFDILRIKHFFVVWHVNNKKVI